MRYRILREDRLKITQTRTLSQWGETRPWVACESSQLKFFTPDPGPSIAESKHSGKDARLPPGMTKGK